MWDRGELEADSIASFFEKQGLVHGSKIIELGCGNGRVAIPLAKKGYNVTCLDISNIFIEDANKKAERERVTKNFNTIVYDAYRVDELFSGEYDAAYLNWTTLLGYCLDKKYDRELFEKIYKIVKTNGLLLVLNTANRDLLVARLAHTGSRTSYVLDLGDILVIESTDYDPVSSTSSSRWAFYKKRNKDLEYIDEIAFKLRIYGVDEVVELAEYSGWKLVGVYHDISRGEPYWPGRSPLNIVFKKS